MRAGIAFALTEAMDEGHCGLPAETLVPATAKLLEVPAELVEEALHLELGAGTVIADDLDGRRCVFLAGLYRAVREIAEKLAILPSEDRLGPRLMPIRRSHGSSGEQSWRSPAANGRQSASLWPLKFSQSPVGPASAKPRWSIRC